MSLTKFMPKISKKNIVGIAMVAILFFIGIIIWNFSRKEEFFMPEEFIEDEHENIKQRLIELGLGNEDGPLSEEEHEDIDRRLRELDLENEDSPLSEEEHEDIDRRLREL